MSLDCCFKLQLCLMEAEPSKLSKAAESTVWACVGTGLLLDLGVDMDAMQARASVKTKTRANSTLRNSAHGYDWKKTNLVVFLPIKSLKFAFKMTEISRGTDFIFDLVNRMNIWTYLPRWFASPCQPLGAISPNPSRHKHSSSTGTRLLEKKQVISLWNSQPR